MLSESVQQLLKIAVPAGLSAGVLTGIAAFFPVPLVYGFAIGRFAQSLISRV